MTEYRKEEGKIYIMCTMISILVLKQYRTDIPE